MPHVYMSHEQVARGPPSAAELRRFAGNVKKAQAAPILHLSAAERRAKLAEAKSKLRDRAAEQAPSMGKIYFSHQPWVNTSNAANQGWGQEEHHFHHGGGPPHVVISQGSTRTTTMPPSSYNNHLTSSQPKVFRPPPGLEEFGPKIPYQVVNKPLAAGYMNQQGTKTNDSSAAKIHQQRQGPSTTTTRAYQYQYPGEINHPVSRY
ncbi:unnamed protein product [Amoebophrya sp. A120]|nr:unnamed protein product [Amoebophrya sp. A120]|eukprot:GSA120T00014182001.1